MMLSVAALAGQVVDFGAIPWWTAAALITGIAWALLEARLVKAGFVRQKALDEVAAKLEGCVRTTEMDGLSRRMDEKLASADRDREAVKSMCIMTRDDLDGTRDRTTRLEGQHESLSTRLVDSLKPLPGIESTLRELLVSQGRLATEIENLKRGRNGNGGT
jgi:hypothetical protein